MLGPGAACYIHSTNCSDQLISRIADVYYVGVPLVVLIGPICSYFVLILYVPNIAAPHFVFFIVSFSQNVK